MEPISKQRNIWIVIGKWMLMATISSFLSIVVMIFLLRVELDRVKMQQEEAFQVIKHITHNLHELELVNRDLRKELYLLNKKLNEKRNDKHPATTTNSKSQSEGNHSSNSTQPSKSSKPSNFTKPSKSSEPKNSSPKVPKIRVYHPDENKPTHAIVGPFKHEDPSIYEDFLKAGIPDTLPDQSFQVNDRTATSKIAKMYLKDIPIVPLTSKIQVSDSKSIQPISKSEILQKAKSVVKIDLLDMDEPSGQGSGVIVSPDGLVVTNYHLFETSRFTSVRMEYKMKDDDMNRIVKVDARELKVVLVNESQDLVMFYLPTEPEGYPFLTLNPHFSVLDKVYTVGNPLDTFLLINSGEITGKVSFPLNEIVMNETLKLRKMISHSAMIDNGSSGGALINEQGELIGITSNGMGEAVFLSIPIQMVIDQLDSSNLHFQ